MYYVYILKCKDERTYIGCTNGIRERIFRHNNGHIFATKYRLPVRLFAYFGIVNKYTAFNFEKYLKSGSGRAFLAKHIF